MVTTGISVICSRKVLGVYLTTYLVKYVLVFKNWVYTGNIRYNSLIRNNNILEYVVKTTLGWMFETAQAKTRSDVSSKERSRHIVSFF